LFGSHWEIETMQSGFHTKMTIVEHRTGETERIGLSRVFRGIAR
jgi:hypothetical protein